MKFKWLLRRVSLAKIQFSLHSILVRLLLFSFLLNLVLFFLQESQVGLACTDIENSTCNDEIERCHHNFALKNTTVGVEKSKDSLFRVSGTLTVSREDAVLVGEQYDKQVFLTIGIPTIERKGHNYLTTTIDSLLYNMSSAKDFSAKIVILLADVKKSVRQRRLQELLSRYGNYLTNGDIHVITVPPKVYPPLRGLSTTLHDTEQRMFWRSKQTIDFAFLMLYCKSFSPYYLQLEDDVIATKDYDVYMKRYIKEKEGSFWFNLDFSNLGFIGKLYRSEDLEKQARFFRLFYSEMPVDLLMSVYRAVLGSDVTQITYFRNLFLHIGYQSSSLSR